MKRVKERWDAEYPHNRRTAQNLTDNARRLKKEGWGRQIEIINRTMEQQNQQPGDQQRKSLEWTTEMKVTLIKIDEEERRKGRGFMKRVKARWDMKFPEYESASWQKLRDNAARFKKDPEIKNLILVRQREEIQIPEVRVENNQEGNNDGHVWCPNVHICNSIPYPISNPMQLAAGRHVLLATRAPIQNSSFAIPRPTYSARSATAERAPEP